MSSIIYTWEITGVKVKDHGPLTDVIVQTYWKKIGTDAFGNVGTFSGATPFNPHDVNHDGYVDFKDITQQSIIEWLQEIVTGTYEEHVNAEIEKQIAAINSPIVEKDLPWLVSTTETVSSNILSNTTPVSNTVSTSNVVVRTSNT